MTWTFLTNHGLVLLAISRHPHQPMRQVAQSVGITERTCHAIVKELEDDGYLMRSRVGRSNVYTIVSDRPMCHPLTKDHTIGELLKLLR